MASPPWLSTSIPILLLLCVIQLEGWRGRDTQGQNSSLASVPGFQYTTWNTMVICNAAQKPLKPSSLEELQDIVRHALHYGYTVKPLGRRHSGTDIICTEGLPVSMLRVNHFSYDTNTGYATVGAGAAMGYFLENLHNVGRTIYGIPSYADITVGGAVATGAHGTSLQDPASPSDQIVAVVVVDGWGNARRITDPETLRAFRASLGLLGIVYELTFSTTPQFKIHIRHYPVSESVLWKENEIVSLATKNDRFQFFWFPTSKRIVMSVGNRVPMSRNGDCQTYFVSEGALSTTGPLSEAFEAMQEQQNHLGYLAIQSAAKLSMYQRVPGRSPIFTIDGKTVCEPAIGYNHLMSSNRCIECPWNNGNASVFNFEYAAIIPLTELQGALKTMKAILDENPIELPFTGIYVRFLLESDGLMTINSGHASVAIEWLLITRVDRFNKPMLGMPTSQALIQALVTKHRGRSHWGKNGPLYTQQNVLKARFPHLPTFVRYMEEFDPRGVFLNDFGRRIRFGSTKTSMDSYTNHCALVDRCVCQKDEDCGDGSKDSYLCDTIQGYKVCKENAAHYKAYRGRVVRKFVGFFTGAT